MSTHRHDYRMLARLLTILGFLGLASMPGRAADPTPPADLEGAVEYLLSRTLESDATFVRNGKSYSAEAAVEHMKKKYVHFLKKGEVHTPEDFIRLAATKSILSGKAYRLRLPDGSEQYSADWLTGHLKQYRSHRAGE